VPTTDSNEPTLHRPFPILLLAAPLALAAQKAPAPGPAALPAPPPVAQQQIASLGDPPVAAATATLTSAVATRVSVPPVIDGRENDEVWAHAQLIDSFRQFQPKEDSTPTFRTTAKVAYDDKYLYVFVRAYDPHPDSIVALLSRRDVRTQSEWIKVMVDSYHDKRTGYEFAVNPLGVKRDYYTFNDQEEDESWDAVWDAETRIDSTGWTAEFRIPFDQLRFAAAPNMTMGFGIWRDIARLNERDSWPVYRYSKPGISSQLGEITGIQGLAPARHLEVTPYVVTKNITYPGDNGYSRHQDFTAGADFKYGVTTNLTLDATVNPDFGQVESDPAVLNLSAFETFLHEQRPFFVEGTGIFRFDISCNNGCTGLFYSRRIGRQPQLSDGQPGTPTNTTILGAAKLTGRSSAGLSVGVLDALTASAENADGTIAEPGTNYFAGRLSQEFRDGQSAIGVMATSVNRQYDPYSALFLRQDAYAGGVDFRHQFAKRTYELSGFVTGSYVSGSDSAIALTQSSSTHLYQRPGSGLTYDPTRTSLTGDAEKLGLSKIGGGIVRFNTSLLRISPGYEINDMGYLAQAGGQSLSNWVGLQWTQPHAFYRQFYLNFNEFNNWTTQGFSGQDQSGMGANINANTQLKNGWFLNAGFEDDNFLPSYDAWYARGGPAVRHSPVESWWSGFQSDPRMKVGPDLSFFGFQGSVGRSHGWGVDPDVRVTYSSSLSMVIGLHYDLNVDNGQYVDRFIAGTSAASDTTYTFARLHQRTVAATIRFDAVFTPRLSLQFYGQPYISVGSYSNWRQLSATPQATNYDARYAPYANDSVQLSSYDFEFQELNVNTVLRWEYRRGSALFLVWTHGRSLEDYGSQYTQFSPAQGVNSLFAIHPMNTFLVKISYWLSL
jgi:hypothetical protein